jgi:hypothetical protein
MYKVSNENSNRIKQAALCCIHCGKSYKKKTNLYNHSVICDLLHNEKSSSKDDDDIDPLPSQRKMYQMLIELGKKYNKLEEKVEEMNKYVVKKKKKINVIEWLNANMKPVMHFDAIIDTIIVTEQDVNMIMENAFNDTLNEIFSRTIYDFKEGECPLFAFQEKTNAFYVFDKDNEWHELSRERLVKFLNKVHMKVSKVFYDWKQTKMDRIKSDDIFAISCDKTFVKLMSVEFNQENILAKVRNNMYAKLKTEIKAFVEYEFEF